MLTFFFSSPLLVNNQLKEFISFFCDRDKQIASDKEISLCEKTRPEPIIRTRIPTFSKQFLEKKKKL
jgi:hypothetical protein